MVSVAPGGISNDFGFPASRSVIALVGLWAIVIIFIKAIKIYNDASGHTANEKNKKE